ncbi:hypothetical protein CSB90_6943 [Pseudomonas aeruginosa]|nr:hypothetical protein CSB90_6943 [Pseudomonas aeruginosa]
MGKDGRASRGEGKLLKMSSGHKKKLARRAPAKCVVLGYRAGGQSSSRPAPRRSAAACNLLAARRTQQSRRARPARGG